MTYDSSDFEASESEDSLEEDQKYQPETEKILIENVKYDNPDFKRIVKKGIKYIMARKTKERLKEERNKDRLKRIQANKKVLWPIFGRSKLISKLVDMNYLKRRYSNLSPFQKFRQKRSDSKRYDIQALEKKQVLGFIKQQVVDQLSQVLTDFIDA